MLEYISSDRKTYQERFNEAVSHIPLYTKDWTNFNPSDPGITILEVLTGYETLAQEKIDTIPPIVREKLLNMMGFHVKKGRPARLLLASQGLKENVTLPQNHRFIIGDIIFETMRQTELCAMDMIAAFRESQSGFKDISMLLDRETKVPIPIFGKNPQNGNSFYLVTSAMPEPGQELILYVDLKMSMNRNPLNEKLKNPFADVSFEILTASGYKECKVRDYTNAFLKSGEIRLRMPEEAAVQGDETPVGGYILKVTLKEAHYDVAPKALAIHGPLFEVWQKLSISESHTYQRLSDITLRSSIIGEAYIDVYCKEEKGNSYRKYNYLPTLDMEGRYYRQFIGDDGFYHIDFDKSTTGYGPEKVKNCVKVVCYTETVMRQYSLGKVLGYDNQEIKLPFKNLCGEGFSVIARREDGKGGYIYDFVRPDFEEDGALFYRLLENDGILQIEDAGDFIGADLFLAGISITQGSAGNIRAGNELLTSVKVAEEPVFFYNPGPGTGGQERERVEDVRKRFLKDMEDAYTAVTESDYEQLVKQTPGLIIHKAKAYMDEERNIVRIAVKPGTEEDFPGLTEHYKSIIHDHLEMRRLLSTRIELLPPLYTKVNVTGTVYVKLNYDNCKERIEECIKEKIDYITTDKNFGDVLVFDDVFHAVELLDCVENVYDLSILPHSTAYVKLEDTNLLPDKNCLLYPGDVQIEVVTYDK